MELNLHLEQETRGNVQSSLENEISKLEREIKRVKDQGLKAAETAFESKQESLKADSALEEILSRRSDIEATLQNEKETNINERVAEHKAWVLVHEMSALL